MKKTTSFRLAALLPMLLIPVLLAAAAGWVVDRLTVEEVPPDTVEGAVLYRRILDHWPGVWDPAGGRLTLPRCDLALEELAVARVAGRPSPVDDPGWETRDRLLGMQCGSRAGGEVVRQAELFNAGAGFLSVRDDGEGAGAALPSGPALAGDRPNLWDASDRLGQPVAPVDLFVPERYRYVTVPPRPGFSDWKSFDAAHPDGVRLERVLAAETAVTVQVIGRLDPARSVLPARAAIVWRCAVGPCGQAAATGAEVVVPAGGGRIALWVAPVPEAVLPVPGLLLVRSRDGSAPKWVRGGPPPGKNPPPLPGALTILSADGVILWEEDLAAKRPGRPTKAALDAGLLPLLGYASQDRQGLAGILARRPDATAPLAVRLTIDMRAQRAAHEILNAHLDARFGPDDPYRAYRRAAVVLMNPDTGALLAVAGYPLPESVQKLSAWDFASARATEDADLLQAVWKGRSVIHAPGSTFKLVTALAGLMTARTDPAVAAMIQGCRAAAGFLPCAGLRTAVSMARMVEKAFPVNNARHNSGAYETINEMLGKKRRDPACLAREDGGPAASARVPDDFYGMAEAIRDSLNQWFVALEGRHDAAAGAVGRNLTAAMKVVGILGPPLDLAGSARPRLGGMGSPADVLHPDPLQTDFASGMRYIDAVNVLSRVSIGQRLQLVPLDVVQISVAIARGRRAIPYLLGSWNDQMMLPPEGATLPVSTDPIRQGMKMVTETGTASKAFRTNDKIRQASCLVWGKTGTAEIPKPREKDKGRNGEYINTASFTGWAEAEAFAFMKADDAAEAAWTQPVAFAVFVSHVHGKNRFGGDVAASIQSAILHRLADPVVRSDRDNP